MSLPTALLDGLLQAAGAVDAVVGDGGAEGLEDVEGDGAERGVELGAGGEGEEGVEAGLELGQVVGRQERARGTPRRCAAPQNSTDWRTMSPRASWKGA